MSLADPWALELIVAAFAGGAFGAAIGALPSFALAGLAVVLGETVAIARTGLGASALPADITGAISFGPVFGPHVAFGGGAAAVAYAARRGYVGEDADADFDYHPAKRITRGLGSRPNVLAVGGVFGVLGHGIAGLSGTLGLPTDPVALGVVGSALLHRAAFGYSLVGAAPRQLLDMSPFERGTRVDAPGTEAGTRADGGDARLAVEPWLPYQYRWSHVAGLGVLVGLLGGYVAYVTGSAFLAFGFSVVPLGLLSAGMERVPVTHHVTLPASTAVLAMAGASGGFLAPGAVAGAVPPATALAVGALFGLVGALLGELIQRALYAHADTHLDPPAASIVCTSLLIATLAAVGVLPTAAWIPGV